MLFSKGSYESVIARCRPDTIPNELADVVQSRSYEGYYIIAVAYKVLSESNGTVGGAESRGHSMSSLLGDMSPTLSDDPFGGAQSSSSDGAFGTREELESDGLTFLGLLYFRNELRESSPRAITELKNGRIKCVMMTGDSQYTALSVAKKCGIVQSEFEVILGKVDDAPGDMVWEDVPYSVAAHQLGDSGLNLPSHPHDYRTNPFGTSTAQEIDEER